MGVCARYKEPGFFTNLLKENGGIVINQIEDTPENIERLNKLYRMEVTDSIDVTPSCHCGHTGTDSDTLALSEEPIKCEVCETYIQDFYDKEKIPMLYLQNPIGVRKFIIPDFLRVMCENTSITPRYNTNIADIDKVTFSPVLYIMDPSYKIKYKRNDVIGNRIRGWVEDYKDKWGNQRGYNFFVDNIKKLVPYLTTHPHLNPDTKPNKESRVEFILQHYGESIFTEHLYLFNRSLYVFETEGKKSYMDRNLLFISEVVMLFKGIDVQDKFSKMPVHVKESKTVKTLISMTNGLGNYYTNTLPKKNGLARTLHYSSKSIYGMRVVVSSISRDTGYQTIKLPWVGTVAMLKLHITNKLLKKGHTVSQIARFINYNLIHYTRTCHEILKEIINEFPEKKLHLIVQRFPSLSLGNIAYAQCGADDLKINPRDLSASSSVVSVSSSNLDFDGDAHSIFLLTDKYMIEEYRVLDRANDYYNRLSTEGLNSYFELPATTIPNINSLLNSDI